MNTDISAFLNQLDDINHEDTLEIKVPSLDKNLKFKPLSVKQHKEIIKTIMDGFDGNIRMTSVLNRIIEENCLSPGIDFKMYDRAYIFTQLRKNSIGENVTINNNKYNLNDLPSFYFQFDTEKETKYKNITINIQIPSLAKDTLINEKALLDFVKIGSEDKKIKESVNILLTFEIIKFIKEVCVGDTILVFDDLSIFDRKSVVEKLPLKLNNRIIEFITQYKEYEQQLLTFSDGAKLSIDASFLTSE